MYQANFKNDFFSFRNQISPREGEAMITEFTLTAEWNQLASEATDLTYRFGCKTQSSKDDILIAMVIIVLSF
jgi:hypothetical protein